MLVAFARAIGVNDPVSQGAQVGRCWHGRRPVSMVALWHPAELLFVLAKPWIFDGDATEAGAGRFLRQSVTADIPQMLPGSALMKNVVKRFRGVTPTKEALWACLLLHSVLPLSAGDAPCKKLLQQSALLT